MKKTKHIAALILTIVLAANALVGFSFEPFLFNAPPTPPYDEPDW